MPSQPSGPPPSGPNRPGGYGGPPDRGGSGGSDRPGGPGGPGGSGPGRRRAGGGGDDGGRRGRGRKPKKTGWRRFVPTWKVVLATLGIGTLATICMVGVAYSMVKVPNVNKDATVQGTTVLWKDGKQMMKIGSSRTIVPIGSINPNMRWAALAIEDRNFYNEAAISPRSIGRAVINNLSGGGTQGGSTITQQYVKNAYLTQQRTLTRKFKEIFIAVKVGKQYPKEKILENYLNTIFFGRSANGVEAAAQAYFGVRAEKLTVPQAGVLAAKIKQPTYYNPGSTDPQERIDAVKRYNTVLGEMVRMGKLSAADYAKYKDHPAIPKKLTAGNANGGQKGFLKQRVQNALHGMGYDDTKIETGGLKVYTSWDKSLQSKAVQTVENDLAAKHMPKNTRVGLVTMNPTTGEILAAYGGKDYVKRQIDDAYYATAQVGSSFKPYVLAAALEKGIGLKSKFDASAPAWFDTNGERVPAGTLGAAPFTNDEGNTNQVVDLVKATAESYNTVYVPLGFKAGSTNVFQLAEKAGLQGDKMKPQVGQGGFFLGQADMAPLYQASGYSTIANDGEFITPHSIVKVIEPGKKVTMPKLVQRRAFRADVAHDVQYAMQAVVKEGTGVRAALAGRPAAGKTGTTNQNNAAWFSGFTPKQMVTTIGMWRYDDEVPKGKHKHKGRFQPLQHVGVYGKVNGGDLPAQIWHDYMTEALSGKPVQQFDPPAYVGNTNLFATPSPTPSPSDSASPTPTCMPGQDPAVDQCKPDPGANNPRKICRQHPEFPQCQQPPTPPPSKDCQQPVFGGCPTTPPPSNPGGNGGGGNGKGGGNGGNQVQQQAARPIDE
jgi:membrane peptidoglycan carboxypeptidase